MLKWTWDLAPVPSKSLREQVEKCSIYHALPLIKISQTWKLVDWFELEKFALHCESAVFL